jgi:hypothetical protein
MARMLPGPQDSFCQGLAMEQGRQLRRPVHRFQIFDFHRI